MRGGFAVNLAALHPPDAVADGGTCQVAQCLQGLAQVRFRTHNDPLAAALHAAGLLCLQELGTVGGLT